MSSCTMRVYQQYTAFCCCIKLQAGFSKLLPLCSISRGITCNHFGKYCKVSLVKCEIRGEIALRMFSSSFKRRLSSIYRVQFTRNKFRKSSRHMVECSCSFCWISRRHKGMGWIKWTHSIHFVSYQEIILYRGNGKIVLVPNGNTMKA
jgi:hypothetical protein